MPSGVQALKEVSFFSSQMYVLQLVPGGPCLLSIKALYTQKTQRQATLKYLVFYNKKNMEGCTQLIPVQLQVCGNSVNPISVVPDWKVVP